VHPGPSRRRQVNAIYATTWTRREQDGPAFADGKSVRCPLRNIDTLHEHSVHQEWQHRSGETRTRWHERRMVAAAASLTAAHRRWLRFAQRSTFHTSSDCAHPVAGALLAATVGMSAMTVKFETALSHGLLGVPQLQYLCGGVMNRLPFQRCESGQPRTAACCCRLPLSRALRDQTTTSVDPRAGASV